MAVDDEDNVIFTEETDGCLGIWKVVAAGLVMLGVPRVVRDGWVGGRTTGHPLHMRVS